MPAPIENYVSQIRPAKMRRQAIVVWSIFAGLIFVWTLLIMAAPLAEANNLTAVSSPLYKFFGYLCHQNPARSFDFQEHAFAVCSRCFGIYFGLFTGFTAYPFLRSVEDTEPLPRFWLFLAMVPMAIDWLLGALGVWENTHLSRVLTGVILGAGCAIFIIPALIEITRNLSSRGKVKRLSV